MTLDKQAVELLGRQRLLGELLRNGPDVAVPAPDRGVNLIASADLSRKAARMVHRPFPG